MFPVKLLHKIHEHIDKNCSLKLEGSNCQSLEFFFPRLYIESSPWRREHAGYRLIN